MPITLALPVKRPVGIEQSQLVPGRFQPQLPQQFCCGFGDGLILMEFIPRIMKKLQDFQSIEPAKKSLEKGLFRL